METLPVYTDAPQQALPRYVSHKIVRAAKIAFIQDCPNNDAELVFEDGDIAPVVVSRDWVQRRGAQPGGYYLVYGDGYTSWCPERVFLEGYVAAGDWGLRHSQEPKYTVSPAGRIVNRHTGRPIPDDEPVFVLRAQDLRALPALKAYRDLLPPEQCASVDERLLAFSAFAERHPERMKLPDSKPPMPPEPTSINARRTAPAA